MVNYLLPQSALRINTAPMTNALNQYRQGMNQQFDAERQADWRKEDMDWRQAQANKAEANSLRDYNLRARQFDANSKHQNNQIGLQQDRLGLQQERLGLERKRFREESAARKQTMIWNAVQRAAGVAQSVAGERDPQRQAAMWAQFLSSHPRVAADLPRELHGDPVMGSQFVMAKARGYQDPLQARLNMAKIKEAEAKAIGGGSKPPAGYAWNADGSLRAIEGGPATKLGGDVAGRIALMQNGLRELPKARNIFNEIGLGGRANMLLNRGQAGEARRIVQTLVEAQLRALTGAAATEEETERLMNFYGPTSTDTPQTMMRKLKRLEDTIKESITLLRTGRIEQPRQSQSTTNNDLPVMTPEQASRMPPGTMFMTTDGRPMRVPGGGQ